MRHKILVLVGTALLAVGLSACGGSSGGDTDKASLQGAGSSLVEPMVQAWIPEVRDRFGIDMTYSPIGSGGGIQAITTRTVDFGASDAPLSPDQAKACKGCLLVPWALSATTVSHNVPGVGTRPEADGPRHRRHLPRQDHRVVRSAHHEAEPWQAAPVAGDRADLPLGRVG